VRGITLTPPWGTLIAVAARFPNLGKQIETRSWPIPAALREQPLAIHQAKGLAHLKTEEALAKLCASSPFREALSAVGITSAAQLPRGQIVAVATPIDCVGTLALSRSLFWGTPQGRTWPQITEPERSFGNYALGRYAWLLDQISALALPVNCKGAQGLWVVPDDVEKAIRELLPCP
jgi:hypothetical protein